MSKLKFILLAFGVPLPLISVTPLQWATVGIAVIYITGLELTRKGILAECLVIDSEKIALFDGVPEALMNSLIIDDFATIHDTDDTGWRPARKSVPLLPM